MYISENVSKLKKLEYLNLALNNIEKIENLEGKHFILMLLRFKIRFKQYFLNYIFFRFVGFLVDFLDGVRWRTLTLFLVIALLRYIDTQEPAWI